ncbi:hypothetical protein ACFL49_03105, partial [Candidatus Omnitrophota bacterium]
ELDVIDGNNFGPKGVFTFELFRGGTFSIDAKQGILTGESSHYGDVSLIRSTYSLPSEYKIRVQVGDIDFGLEHLVGLKKDVKYHEGPLNENGCYLIAITDQRPDDHYTNDWWHRHRKLVIDVDNNAWGYGMPNPIFMVYFDRDNKLMAFDGDRLEWVREWEKGFEYERKSWYYVELEKKHGKYTYRILDEGENLLRESQVNVDEVWHTEEQYPEYFVIGDPHENYYQGSFKLKLVSISL